MANSTDQAALDRLLAEQNASLARAREKAITEGWPCGGKNGQPK